jgi:alpha-ketoglutarate-dependent taurine dioxygenase
VLGRRPSLEGRRSLRRRLLVCCTTSDAHPRGRVVMSIYRGRSRRVHDLVIWDNRFTMHRGTAFDGLRRRRDVQRATASDVAKACEQEGVEVAAA